MTTGLIHHDRLTAFLHRLHILVPADYADAFVNECIDNGGIYLSPPDRGPERHYFQISLHGVTALASSEADAIETWIVDAWTLVLAS